MSHPRRGDSLVEIVSVIYFGSRKAGMKHGSLMKSRLTTMTLGRNSMNQTDTALWSQWSVRSVVTSWARVTSPSTWAMCISPGSPVLATPGAAHRLQEMGSHSLLNMSHQSCQCIWYKWTSCSKQWRSMFPLVDSISVACQSDMYCYRSAIQTAVWKEEISFVVLSTILYMILYIIYTCFSTRFVWYIVVFFVFWFTLHLTNLPKVHHSCFVTRAHHLCPSLLHRSFSWSYDRETNDVGFLQFRFVFSFKSTVVLYTIVKSCITYSTPCFR